MTSLNDDCFFIIKLRYQLIFNVKGIELQILFNNKTLLPVELTTTIDFLTKLGCNQVKAVNHIELTYHNPILKPKSLLE